MFSLVDIQESFPNLHGAEIFNKLFKKAHASFAEPRGSTVHNLWVLPGHIIVSLDEGYKLLSFDLLPKQKPWPDVIDFLSVNQNKKKKGNHQSTIDVFYVGSSPLYIFIVLKNAEVHVWKFTHPEFEWQHVCKLNLSSGKNVQIMSVCFDQKAGTLFWCERRTPTQCCVCKGTVAIETEKEKEMLVDKSDILHNCPPMQLYLVGPAGVLLRPTANCPTGLTMYWSASANRIQLHMWSYLSSGAFQFSASSDFQSLVTESISLWINQCSSDPAAIAYCTHPITQELLILDSSSELYSAKINAEGKPVMRKLCTLSRERVGDLNQRKSYKIFAFKKFLGLLLEDSELLIFETYKGMLIWANESLKHERVTIWVSQGSLPQVGIWCQSFVQVIVSESILKQAETMLKLKTKSDRDVPMPSTRKVSKEYTLHLTFKGHRGKKGKETYVVVDQEGEDESSNDGQKEEQTLSSASEHNISELLLLVSEYLNDWNTKNLSSEVCLWLLNHTKFNSDEKTLEFKTLEEFRRIFTLFDNPCIALALLHKNRKYRVALGEFIKEVITKNNVNSLKNLNPSLFEMIQKYASLSEEISDILNDVPVNHTDAVQGFHFKEKFELQLKNENLTKLEINEIIEWAAETRPKEFIDVIISVLQLNEESANCSTDKDESTSIVLQSLLWKNILRKDTNSFEIICNELWIHAADLLINFVRKAQNIASASEPLGFLQVTRRPSFITLADVSQRAINAIPYKAFVKEIAVNQIKILAELILLPQSTDSIIEACKLYLECHLYTEAVSLLDSVSLTPELHDRLFYMILASLIENSNVGSFSQQLCQKIPSNFTVVELSHLLKNFEDPIQPYDVFVPGSNINLFGHFEPLLTALIERESTDKAK